MSVQPISQHLRVATEHQRAPAESSTRIDAPIPIEWVERVFERLHALYGARFASFWDGANIDSVKKTWQDELSLLRPDEIARGLEACRTIDWPPSLPEFMKLARPPVEYERAFHEACEQIRRRASNRDTWTHPAIFYAAATFNRGELDGANYRALAKRWAAALNAAIADVNAGRASPTIPPRRDALPQPGQATTPKEVARNRAAECVRIIKAPIQSDHQANANDADSNSLSTEPGAQHAACKT